MTKRVRPAGLLVLALALGACGIDATGRASPADVAAADGGVGGGSGDGGASGRDGGGTVADASPVDDGGISVTDGGADADAGVVNAGTALELSKNDYVDVGALAIPADFTIEAWVKPKTASSETYIVAKDKNGDASGQFRFGLETGGGLFFIMSDASGDDHGLYQGSNYVVRSAAPLAMGAWTHVAVTKSGATFTLYAGSATPVVKTANAAFVHAGTASFRLGGRVASNGTGLDGGFDGVIDDVRMWNVARTAVEIAATRSVPPPLATPGLVTYFRCDEGSGTTTTDAKGGLPGTLVGSLKWVTSAAF